MKTYYAYRWTKEQKELHIKMCGPDGESKPHPPRGTVIRRGLSITDAQDWQKAGAIRAVDDGYEYGWTSEENVVFAATTEN